MSCKTFKSSSFMVASHHYEQRSRRFRADSRLRTSACKTRCCGLRECGHLLPDSSGQFPLQNIKSQFDNRREQPQLYPSLPDLFMFVTVSTLEFMPSPRRGTTRTA
eukprot:scaffold501502_cov16-Prasinocladus_malaysianus.AAC.1